MTNIEQRRITSVQKLTISSGGGRVLCKHPQQGSHSDPAADIALICLGKYGHFSRIRSCEKAGARAARLIKGKTPQCGSCLFFDPLLILIRP